jgi:hypothetical protein
MARADIGNTVRARGVDYGSIAAVGDSNIMPHTLSTGPPLSPSILTLGIPCWFAPGIFGIRHVAVAISSPLAAELLIPNI